MDEIKLNSVNWQHGMLLSPEHFIRQEQYLDALILWTLRYTGSAYGLVGGGPRLIESERGAVRHDPIVVLDEDEETIGISITQARGITPGGRIIDIQPNHPVIQRFPRRGSRECRTATSILSATQARRKQWMEKKMISIRK